ncbi:hypothetical protein [Pseudanabaena sp. 'Roaring Creek']|uniref:hypothetical protein n=1 Tax=Pseudanabaena sp. 'Roaring Creek' TaxID=1681830 RepID=UPI0006D7B529|nr:hypothetical protein [Pseudanabaena sp. 'Roaring Creek']
MPNFVTQSLQDLQQQVPIISDKVLVDLVNGMQVNDDLSGYDEAKMCLEPILKTLTIEAGRHDSLDSLQQKNKQLANDPHVY